MYKYVKRLVDIVLAVPLLVLALPFSLAFGVFIPFKSKGPMLYSQIRVGKNREKFRIWKLRTREVDTQLREAADGILSSENHSLGIGIYPYGEFLRKYSIDELLQIWNVLLGRMSFIGPRARQPEETSEEKGFDNRILSVRPGITGWAQINGRDTINKKEQYKLDLFYALNRSFVLDLKIALKTIPVVIKGTGI